MITSSTERLASYPVETTAHNGDLPESVLPAQRRAQQTCTPESFAFARGRKSLDRSVWYSGWLLTFLATAEETRGQCALIEATTRKGNVPPRHIHHREEESFYVLEGEMNVTVGDAASKLPLERWCTCHGTARTPSRSNRSSCGRSFSSLPPDWKAFSRNSVFRRPQ